MLKRTQKKKLCPGGALCPTLLQLAYFKWSRDMPRHDYVRQKIIVCAEIYGGLLAELPSRSPVSSAASSRVRRALSLDLRDIPWFECSS